MGILYLIGFVKKNSDQTTLIKTGLVFTAGFATKMVAQNLCGSSNTYPCFVGLTKGFVCKIYQICSTLLAQVLLNQNLKFFACSKTKALAGVILL